MRKFLLVAAAAVLSVGIAGPVSASTTVGTLASTGSGFSLQANQSIGESILSPGGNLTSFSFFVGTTDKLAGSFNFASFTNGVIGAQIYTTTFNFVGGINTVSGFSTATVAGTTYIAYLSTVGVSNATKRSDINLFEPSSYADGRMYYVGGPILGATPGGTASKDLSFSATFTAVPEPASWAMMIFGMGAVGVAMRRRNKVTSQAALAN